MVEKIILKNIDEYNPVSQSIPLWKDLGLLNWDKTTISSRLNVILKKITIILENYSVDCSNFSNTDLKFDLVPRSFDRIIRSLSKGINLYSAVFNANGWHGETGLEYAASRLISYSNQQSESLLSDRVLPIASKFPSIVNTLYNRRNWHEYGIRTWNDLLRHTFGTVNMEHTLSLTNMTFEFAKNQLLDIYEQAGKLPRLRDSKITNAIGKACQKGNFTNKGVSSWNDLLRLIFGSVNNDYDKYTGEEGFHNAKTFLLQFHKKYNRIPTLKDAGMDSILNPIKQGKWVDRGINSWNDLLDKVFGEINSQSRNTYRGVEGLYYAKQILLEFKQSEQRLPTVKDPGMQSIAAVAYSGEWSFQKIYSWNTLLLYVFGKNNATTRRKYIGLGGLDEAAEFMRDFEKMNKRLPRYKGDGMGSIISAMHRGEWTEFGITKWNDLLYTVFGKTNVVMNKYVGKRGLRIAKREVAAYQKFHKRNPKTKDRGMAGIARAIWRGEWKEFGINSIKDLW